MNRKNFSENTIDCKVFMCFLLIFGEESRQTKMVKFERILGEKVGQAMIARVIRESRGNDFSLNKYKKWPFPDAMGITV